MQPLVEAWVSYGSTPPSFSKRKRNNDYNKNDNSNNNDDDNNRDDDEEDDFDIDMAGMEHDTYYNEQNYVPLIGNNAYGFRLYRNQSTLQMHVDKPETHVISFILHIDSSPDAKPWPILIEDYYGSKFYFYFPLFLLLL